MALSTAKLTELPFRNSISLTSHSPSSSSSSLNFLFFYSYPKPTLSLLKPFSSLRTTPTPQNPKPNKQRYPWDDDHDTENLQNPSKNPNPNSTKSKASSSAPWLNKWPSSNNPTIESSSNSKLKSKDIDSKRDDDRVQTKYFDGKGGTSAIERIVLRLRNLGLGSDDEEENDEIENSAMPVTGNEKLGDLLKRDWIRPDTVLMEEEDDDDDDEMVLPWERRQERTERDEEGDKKGLKKRPLRAPTLAELTIEDEQLRRLRRLGMTLRERVSVPKAGVTVPVLEKIHDSWRKSELVRLKFHETLARDMKTAHEIVERRTGGLVIWRSGSVMVVFRGSNYEGPSSRTQSIEREGDSLFVPDVSSTDHPITRNENGATSIVEKSEGATLNRSERITEEEAEYNSLLDGLGPRFEEWWGTGVLPIDADLLPQTIPGYKTPFRLLPTAMRPRLTNAELTNLRKVAKSLPCHFALGRNRHHQGLAAAIIKLWEKSLVAKIAVKRGIQNTNNKLMAEELKNLTGGVLLLRNKYYIVIYRGKDFVPTSVATALAERQEMTKQIQDVEEKVRRKTAEVAPKGEDGVALAGTLHEFYEAQARWGRKISSEEREKMIEEASRAKSVRVVKQVEHKLSIALAKKLRAEKLLSKIEASMVPVDPFDDQETITDEEKFMYRRVGLRMKAYLPLGIRGVFDGVIENMHLHWKHRELVKLISKQKTYVEETARLLEFESGGILVAIERVPKGYALIYYRGKNYRRPISLRPRNLLTKAKALKRAVAIQRYEALSQHISAVEKTIEQMKKEIGDSGDVVDESSWNSDKNGQFNHVGEFTQNKDDSTFTGSNEDEEEDDESTRMGSDEDEEEDLDWEDDEQSDSSSFSDEESEFSRILNNDHPLGHKG